MFNQLHLCLLILVFSLPSCGTQKERQNDRPNLDMENLYAWCIVPFDNQERSPEERIQMLKELGFQSYVYDWREKHLPEMAGEWRLAKEQGVEVMGVWLWIDDRADRPGRLSEANEKIFQTLAEVGLKTQIWLGFNANYFENLSDEASVQKGVEIIRYLGEKAGALGCKIALYNHGDWFGEPENQVRIIQELPELEVGIVYNFHHGHHQIDRFQEIAKAMAPHLWAVSLNGMRKDGPKILPIGQGDSEGKMLTILQEAGFKGPYGILGHVEEADVRQILERNLAGLKGLN